MNTLLVCIATVALGELGDKTQLLALLLAVRYRRPLPIIAGILAATVANHLLAALLGAWVRGHIPAQYLEYGIGASFLAVALWTLHPDSLDDDGASQESRFGLFGLTLVSFFLAEVGDKTQIATALLAARFGQPLLVVSGTTLGMLLVDIPSVLFAQRLAGSIRLSGMRLAAALVFGALGAAAFVRGATGSF